MFHFAFESGSGILSVRVSGSWTLSEIDRYAREAGPQFAQAREQAGRLRLLVDLGATAVISQSLLDPLARAGMQYSRADDRVALVVNSTLLKLQMRRMIADAPAEIFVTLDEAAAWLTQPQARSVGAAR